jgi:hypothetical protein
MDMVVHIDTSRVVAGGTAKRAATAGAGQVSGRCTVVESQRPANDAQAAIGRKPSRGSWRGSGLGGTG